MGNCTGLAISWGIALPVLLQSYIKLRPGGFNDSCPFLNVTQAPHTNSVTQNSLRVLIHFLWFFCCCSVAQLFLTLCNPIDCCTPGFPVLHHLPELAQTHVHWVGDAIQPPHPVSSPSPPAFYISQHQGLFQWVGSLHQVAKVFELSDLPRAKRRFLNHSWSISFQGNCAWAWGVGCRIPGEEGKAYRSTGHLVIWYVREMQALRHNPPQRDNTSNFSWSQSQKASNEI